MDSLVDDLTTASGLTSDGELYNVKPPTYWIPCLVILAIASVAGTFGNVTILFLIFTKKKLRNVETIFIVNLAISDLYVTSLADPMSLLGKFNSLFCSIR